MHIKLLGKQVQWRIQGENPTTAPPLKLAMEFGPLGGRKSNDSIVNLSKCKDFGPPISMSVTDLAPLWGKKDHQKFWEIDEIFGGNSEIFSVNA